MSDDVMVRIGSLQSLVFGIAELFLRGSNCECCQRICVGNGTDWGAFAGSSLLWLGLYLEDVRRVCGWSAGTALYSSA